MEFIRKLFFKTKSESFSKGCTKCGNLCFAYDHYFQEYCCENCGWVVSYRPSGEIDITVERNKPSPNVNPENVIESNANCHTIGNKELADIDCFKTDNNRQNAEILEQIVSEYGSYIETHPPAGEIRDVSELPYSKEEILYAITQEIKFEDNKERLDALKICANMLAYFQENVGQKHLTPLGISYSEMLSGIANGDSGMREMYKRVAENPDEERYNLFRKKADEELVTIEFKLKKAEDVREEIRRVYQAMKSRSSR